MMNDDPLSDDVHSTQYTAENLTTCPLFFCEKIVN